MGRKERLRRIDAVTDAALSHLDVDELFAELLQRVRTLLAVDAATIMLTDPESRELVAAASDGLEDEVWQGLRLAEGTGFASRVVAERKPIVLNQVDATTVASPAVLEKGMVTLLGVPMIAGGDVVGVLQVGTLQSREFTPDDADLLQMAGDRAAAASLAGLARLDRAATLALQRGLLPTHLPLVAGLDLAARYVPGHKSGVGGDWYDVFSLRSGRIGVVVGDVAGRGLRAAVIMGRLRSALRAYALEWEEPAKIMTLLDLKARHFETGSLATVSYATLDPETGAMEISLAGHLPPVLADATGAAHLATIVPDAPVGVGDTRPRTSTTVDVPPGAMCLFYTDGLVERRDEHIDVGLARLCDVVRPGTAEGVCARVVAEMGVVQAHDDIALLAVSRTSL